MDHIFTLEPRDTFPFEEISAQSRKELFQTWLTMDSGEHEICWWEDLWRFRFSLAQSTTAICPHRCFVVDRHLEEIASENGFEDFPDEFRRAIQWAVLNYWTWWKLNRPIFANGLGNSDEITTAYEALKAILERRYNPQLRNRLAVGQIVSGDCRTTVLKALSSERDNEAFEKIAAVTHLLKCSSFDARKIRLQTRFDLRAAAEPLLEFWIDMGCSVELYQRGKPTPVVQFLYNCLALIDRSVTTRLVADFGTELNQLNPAVSFDEPDADFSQK